MTGHYTDVSWVTKLYSHNTVYSSVPIQPPPCQVRQET